MGLLHVIKRDVGVDRLPWDRQPAETQLAYTRFLQYLDYGPESRSYQRLAADLNLKKCSVAAMGYKNSWKSRARAYDGQAFNRQRNEQDEERNHLRLPEGGALPPLAPLPDSPEERERQESRAVLQLQAVGSGLAVAPHEVDSHQEAVGEILAELRVMRRAAVEMVTQLLQAVRRGEVTIPPREVLQWYADLLNLQMSLRILDPKEKPENLDDIAREDYEKLVEIRMKYRNAG